MFPSCKKDPKGFQEDEHRQNVDFTNIQLCILIQKIK